MVVQLILDVAFFYLAFTTYKELNYLQIVSQDQSLQPRQQLKEKRRTEERLNRILMKWITIFLIFNFYWVIEYTLFMLPTQLMKLGIGLWILLPQLHGEFFVYNVISDQLDKFEYKVRVFRNALVQKCMMWYIKGARYLLNKFKPYIETRSLQQMKLLVDDMDKEIIKDLTLRKKMVETGNIKVQVGKEVFYRDSSVLGIGNVKPASGSVTDVDAVKRRNQTTRDQSPSGSKYRPGTGSGYGQSSTQPKVNNYMKQSTTSSSRNNLNASTRTKATVNSSMTDYEGADANRSLNASTRTKTKVLASSKQSSQMSAEKDIDSLSRSNVSLSGSKRPLMSRAAQLNN